MSVPGDTDGVCAGCCRDFGCASGSSTDKPSSIFQEGRGFVGVPKLSSNTTMVSALHLASSAWR